MVVVDSSVWIEFFHGRDAEVVEKLRRLLDADEVALAAPVKLELLAGASKRELPRLRRLLSALPLLVPTNALWPQLEGWISKARVAGERFFAMDLLVAGIAEENGARIWSQDDDFTRMARLGFVKLASG